MRTVCSYCNSQIKTKKNIKIAHVCYITDKTREDARVQRMSGVVWNFNWKCLINLFKN